jgi:hypothetical protein
VRAIRTRQYLYIRNYTPDVWPAGMPGSRLPRCRRQPHQTLLIANFDRYYKLSFGKRPAEELYNVEADPGCLKNLYAEASMTMVKRNLRDRMEKVLKEEGDPRLNGNAAFSIRFNTRVPGSIRTKIGSKTSRRNTWQTGDHFRVWQRY